jgi:pimeloyl-ACP methyl ester carboxylesterase
MTLWLGLAALAALIAGPFVAEALRKPMDAEARSKAPGQFATLSRGVTHYQWAGPDTGPVVVCIHGLTTPSFVWGGLVPDLTAAGYRVLTYDLYGRGYSDRPDGAQTPAFFIQQLNDLMAHEGVNRKVSLIGYSMGGIIAPAFAASAPERIGKVVLLAPAGMQKVGSGLLRQLVSLPGLGRWLMLARYGAQLRKGIKAEAGLPTSVPGISDLQANELNFRGFLPAVHRSLLGMLTEDMRSVHLALKQADTPLLAIWGAQDDVIPLAAKETLSSWNPEVSHHVIGTAGHGLTYSHSADVTAQILPFLAKAD